MLRVKGLLWGKGAVFTGDVRNGGVVSAKKVQGVEMETLAEAKRMRASLEEMSSRMRGQNFHRLTGRL